jgi:hypothetical protein
MAIMAVELLMLALGPCVVRRLHQMAANAEFWIVLSKIIKLVCHKTAAGDYHQDECYDKYLGFQGNRFLEPVFENFDLLLEKLHVPAPPPQYLQKIARPMSHCLYHA